MKWNNLIRALFATGTGKAEGLMLLFVRVALGHVFWASGQTKVDGFMIKDSTYFLFADEYHVPLIPSDMAAVMTTIAEHVFPVLLLMGLATRMSAAALLAMTMVIQLFVYPDAWWPVHSLWIALAAVLIVRGGGLFSLDRLALRAALPQHGAQ